VCQEALAKNDILRLQLVPEKVQAIAYPMKKNDVKELATYFTKDDSRKVWMIADCMQAEIFQPGLIAHLSKPYEKDAELMRTKVVVYYLKDTLRLQKDASSNLTAPVYGLFRHNLLSMGHPVEIASHVTDLHFRYGTKLSNGELVFYKHSAIPKEAGEVQLVEVTLKFRHEEYNLEQEITGVVVLRNRVRHKK